MKKFEPTKLAVGKNLKALGLKKPDEINLGPTVPFHSTEIQGKPLTDNFFFNEDKWLTVVDGSGSQEYFSLKSYKKSSIHWGQLKLFIAELMFLNKYWDPSVLPSPTLVYVGAAPGFHIHMLANMFPQINFELYDGRAFSPILDGMDNVKTFVRLFTEEDVRKYSGRNDVFFVSDIRSLNYNTIVSQTEATQRENERIADMDMKLQMDWVQKIRPVKAHLKFRLPYNYTWLKDEHYTYLDGDIYKQAFPTVTTTETRLVPNLDAPLRNWNFRAYESHMFYHNNVVRDVIKFVNPLTNNIGPISPELGLLSDYDSVVFVTTVKEYLIKFGVSNPSPNQILLLCKEIIKDVGGGRVSLVSIRSGVAVVEDQEE